jgi:hypothetical protein
MVSTFLRNSVPVLSTWMRIRSKATSLATIFLVAAVNIFTQFHGQDTWSIKPSSWSSLGLFASTRCCCCGCCYNLIPFSIRYCIQPFDWMLIIKWPIGDTKLRKTRTIGRNRWETCVKIYNIMEWDLSWLPLIECANSIVPSRSLSVLCDQSINHKKG